MPVFWKCRYTPISHVIKTMVWYCTIAPLSDLSGCGSGHLRLSSGSWYLDTASGFIWGMCGGISLLSMILLHHMNAQIEVLGVWSPGQCIWLLFLKNSPEWQEVVCMATKFRWVGECQEYCIVMGWAFSLVFNVGEVSSSFWSTVWFCQRYCLLSSTVG